MPLKDLMQSPLTVALLLIINESLSAIEAVLAGKMVNLTPEERQRYGSINEVNKLFVNKIRELHISQPQFDSSKVDWV